MKNKKNLENKGLVLGFLIFLSASFLVSPLTSSWAKVKQSKVKYYQMVTGDDPDADESRWNSLYKRNVGYVWGKDPAPFLVRNVSFLPLGRALDLGMGEGRNAVFLAKKGFQVEGVDISVEAIRKAKKLAQESHVRITTITADLAKYKIPSESYDVILVFYYLDRSLIPMIKQGLKRGGMVVFENSTVENLKYNKNQSRRELLEKGELKNLFHDFTEVKYEETDNGKEAFASLIARRP